MATYGTVTKITDTNWVARNTSGVSAGHAETLRAAQLLIERGLSSGVLLRWRLDPGAGAVQRWVGTDSADALPTARRPAAPAARPAAPPRSVKSWDELRTMLRIGGAK
jgi:hypothetical protein